jgi:hypothetical protein
MKTTAKRQRPAAMLLALAAVVSGCSTIESGDVETSGMTASIEVKAKADGSATDVFASISSGTLTTVDLDGDDQLVASSGDVRVDLEENNLLGVVTYAGSLTGISAPGTDVNVAFNRSADKTPAPTSTVALPVPLDISAPAAGTSFSRANDDIEVVLESDASDDAVTVRWAGDCIDTGSLEVPAGQATVTINKDTIEKRAQADANAPDSEPVPDTCTITVTAQRRVEGTLDPAWGGGQIVAVSSATRDLSTAP